MDPRRDMVREACRGGLDGIRVPVAYHGKQLSLTAANFDAASELAEGLTPDAATLVAWQLTRLSPQQIRSVESLAKRDRAAGQVLAALTLKRLAQVRRSAYKLAERALSGDAAAKRRAFSILATAQKNPKRAMESEVLFTACFIRDAMNEIAAAAQPAPAAEEGAPQLSQTPAEQDMTSGAIGFNADGTPYVQGAV